MLLFHLTALCSPCFGAVMMLYKENIILHANLHKLISLILEIMTYTHARGDLFQVWAEMCMQNHNTLSAQIDRQCLCRYSSCPSLQLKRSLLLIGGICFVIRTQSSVVWDAAGPLCKERESWGRREDAASAKQGSECSEYICVYG